MCVCVCVCVCYIDTYTYVGLCPIVQLIVDTLLRRHVHKRRPFFSLLALQPPLGVVFYSPLAGFSLLHCEVS